MPLYPRYFFAGHISLQTSVYQTFASVNVIRCVLDSTLGTACYVFQQFAESRLSYQTSHGLQLRSLNVITSRRLKAWFHSRCVVLDNILLQVVLISLAALLEASPTV